MDYSIHYSRFHDSTDEHIKRTVEGARKLLEPYVPKDRSAPIIDIGCGFGFALLALREMGFTSLIGLETSAQQAQRAKAAGFEVVTTDQPLEWLQQNRRRFAFVVLMDVLEHVPVGLQIQFTTAIQEALKSDGRLFLTVPNANSIVASHWRYIDYTHYSSFTEHSLIFVLKSSGFRDVVFSNIRVPAMKRFPKRIWKPEVRMAIRKWLVRWMWLQVFKAELSWESLDNISFDINLHVVAAKE